VIALFTAEPERLYNRTAVFNALLSSGAACMQCCSPTRIGSMLYHLRQDGAVEKVGIGRFRHRKSEDAAKAFVRAGAASDETTRS
jgi:hypothetical protein